MWDEYLKLILEKYKDKPDSFTLSLGHWEPEELGVPAFRSFLAMNMGELRKLTK